MAYLIGEGSVAFGVGQTVRGFGSQLLLYSLGSRTRPTMLEKQAQRPPMDRMMLDVEYIETRATRQHLECAQRVIEDMLMIYSVELCPVQKIFEIRKFEDRHATGFQTGLHRL